jgi:predicted nucleic acid-binding Zn ribbon protein
MFAAHAKTKRFRKTMSRILPLGQVMTAALKEFGLDKKAQSYSVITGWDAVVGEKVASVTQPQKLERGVLTVRVTSPVWRYELTMRKRDILAKIQTAYGQGQVTDILWK